MGVIDQHANRAIWPAVKIIKGVPGHPEGAVRYPRPEQRDVWERMGVCVPLEDNGRELRLDQGEPLRPKNKRRKRRGNH